MSYKHIDCGELEEFNIATAFRNFTRDHRAEIEAIVTDAELTMDEKNTRMQELVKLYLGDDIPEGFQCKFQHISPVGEFGDMDPESVENARQLLESLSEEMLEKLPPHIRDMLNDLLGPQRPF
jgi:hypothetical protein